MQVPSASKLMTTQQVSDYLRISLSTVHHLTRSGKLKPVKRGRQWQYVKDDIDDYLLSGCNPVKYGGEERRLYRRIACRLPCHAGLLLADGSKKWEGEAEIINISGLGLLLEIPELLFYKDETLRSGLAVIRLARKNSGIYEIAGSIVRFEIYDKSRFGIKSNDTLEDCAELISSIA